jgi:Fe-S cluster biogenesis protein NfuA
LPQRRVIGGDDRAIENAEVVARNVERLSERLRSHGGGVELVDFSSDGALRVRLTGMCAGCYAKPLTVGAVIRPALEGVAGVTRVDVLGARMSLAAYERVGALDSAGRLTSAHSKDAVL